LGDKSTLYLKKSQLLLSLIIGKPPENQENTSEYLIFAIVLDLCGLEATPSEAWEAAIVRNVQ